MTILQHTFFEPQPFGHGGQRRSLQIRETLTATGSEVVTFGYQRLRRSSSWTQLAGAAFRGFVEAVRHPWFFLMLPRLSWFVELGHATKQCDAFNKSRSSSENLMVWESTTPFMWPVIQRMLAEGWKVVAVPHNIEALDYTGSIPGLSRVRLYFEVKILKRVNSVFCISSSDASVYQEKGVACETYHYSPPLETLESLERVKAGRKASEKDVILVSGSASNRFTRDGLRDSLESISFGKLNSTVVVVSRNLVKLQDLRGVRVLTDVSQEELESLMVRTKVLVVRQRRGTGLLTRIVEALISGIPVASDRHAARGFQIAENDKPPEEISPSLVVVAGMRWSSDSESKHFSSVVRSLLDAN